MRRIMTSFLDRIRRRCDRRAQRLVDRMMTVSNRKWRKGDGKWFTASRPDKRFTIVLYLRPDETLVHVGVTADLPMDRDWFQRGFLLALLESSNLHRSAGYRLVPTPGGVTFLLAQSCDCRVTEPEELLRICEELTDDLSRSLVKWYAEGLITAGENYLKTHES